MGCSKSSRFRLVKETSDDDANREKGAFCGTPGFMAPEQAFRYNEVDARSDIYALGAVAYYLLSGRPIFVKKNVVELIAAHANDPVPPLTSVVPNISSELDRIVLRCLAKFPEERYASTNDLYADLNATGLQENWDATKAKTWWQNISRPSATLNPARTQLQS